jgi:hypothetical protein
MNPKEDSTEYISHSLTAQWQLAGWVELRGIDYQLVMPAGLPKLAGVYRIEATDTRELYVGEGANLFRRLRNYENAGWIPDTYSRTNRQVQGWIYLNLSSRKSSFQIHVCTNSEFATAGAGSRSLNLGQKYFRTLLEAATIADRSDWAIVNKQYDRLA